MPNNKKRGEEALSKLERELKSRERKQKARPLGVVAASLVVILALVGGIWLAAIVTRLVRSVGAEHGDRRDARAAAELDPTVLDGTVPRGTMASPEEIAAVVVAVAGPDFGFVTGEVITADASAVAGQEQQLRSAAESVGAELVLKTVANPQRPGTHDVLLLAAAYRDIVG